MKNLPPLKEAIQLKGECWVWPGKLTLTGYARRKKAGKNINIHREIFQAVFYRVPKNMVIDHLCRNRACVNPLHLEVVTSAENIMRGVGQTAINAKKTHCLKGHALKGSNVYYQPKVHGRRCKRCHLDRSRLWKQKKRNERHGLIVTQ